MRRVKVGLLGCGTVGRGFVALVERERDRLKARYAVDVEVARILVRDPDKPRAGIDPALLTTRATDVIDDGCDVIVELVGGVHCAGAYVRRALERRHPVVTANKALLAECGRELLSSAARHGVTLGFEASVCGAVPVVRALRRGLAGDSVIALRGIVNGTCNYVLTRMESDGLTFDEALRMAQARGFAEADPSLDVDGIDSEQKLRILAELAFDAPVLRSDVVPLRGIDGDAVRSAMQGGGALRYVASATRIGGGVTIKVAPEVLDADDPLARVRDENNAVVIRGEAVGDLLLAGRGAGSMPTAAAVLGDVLEAIRDLT